MAPDLALCRIVVKTASLKGKDAEDTSQQQQPSSIILTTQSKQLLIGDSHDIPLETRLQWGKSISDKFFTRPKLDDSSCVRDWDLVLSLDGSVENIADNQAASCSSNKMYPARYRLPQAISDRLSTKKEKIQRAELFALGSILYELISEKELFHNMGHDENAEEVIQSLITKGEFPDDVWDLPMSPRILACWCPQFAKEMLDSRGKDSFQKVITNYIKNHPVLFGIQVAGGIASIASIIALPILGAIGFTAAGPAAGSAAAALQSGIGIVRAGSFFAWCQSAAMGGAAVGGILVTGLAGGGLAVGATVAGALDELAKGGVIDLKGIFLSAFRRDMTDKVEFVEK